jgi:tetratricopeptide (TPR) repeat protein
MDEITRNVDGLSPEDRAQAASAVYVPFRIKGSLPIDASRACLDDVLPPHEVDARPGVVYLPRRPSPVFVGRDAALKLLDDAATGEKFAGRAVQGLGGVGKSEVVLRYAASRMLRYPVTWWINAENTETITLGLAGLAQALHPPAAFAGSLADAAAWAREWLHAHDGWLLVLDDVVDLSLVEPLLGTGRGRVLATSRFGADWARRGLNPIHLYCLDRAASVDLILRRVRRTGRTERAAANYLAEDLGDLPLALEQAAGYIAHHGISIADYRNRLLARTSRATMEDDDTVRAVAQVWALAIDAVRAERPSALRRLDALAYLAPDPIPVDVLTGAAADRLDAENDLALLASYNMISRADGIVTAHRLVQAVTRGDHALSSPPETLPYRNALILLAAAIPPDPADPAEWPRWNALLPHVDTWAAHRSAATDPDGTTALLRGHLLSNATRYRIERGQLREASAVLERLVEENERVLGPDDSEALGARADLASAYVSAGRHSEAISLFEQILVDCERLLGPNDPRTQSIRKQLVNTYSLVGRPGETIPQLGQTAVTVSRELRPDHPDTPRYSVGPDSAGNGFERVGQSWEPDDYHEPDNLYDPHEWPEPPDEPAFDDPYEEFDPYDEFGDPDEPNAWPDRSGEHTDLREREKLAIDHLVAARFNDAIPLFEQLLVDHVQALGEDHPDTMRIRSSLAVGYMVSGRCGEAIPLLERSFVDSTRLLGPDHSATRHARDNLAQAYGFGGRARDAVPLHEQILADRRQRLGEDHPDTLESQDALASAYTLTDRFDEAIALHLETLKARQRVLGLEHPDTLASIANLAFAFLRDGRPEQAISLYEWVLPHCERVFGPDHPITVVVRNSLASAYEAQGEPDDPGHAPLAGTADEMFDRAVALLQQAGVRADVDTLDAVIRLVRGALDGTPADHPDRAGRLMFLGSVLGIRAVSAGSDSDLDEAIVVGREEIAARPSDHPERPGRLSYLSMLLLNRMVRTENLADVHEAVALGREAVASTPADHPNRAMYLGHFGLALRSLADRSGALPDLDSAIEVFREVVAVTSADHPGRGDQLSNLHSLLRSRFDRTRNLPDLEDAVAAARGAVAASPADSSDRITRLSNLSGVLLTRFERTGEIRDLEDAVATARETVAVTPADHPEHAKHWSNLGLALRARFSRLAHLPDLDEAVAISRKVVAATPTDHPDRAPCLLNLSGVLRDRFERTGHLPDLDEAVMAGREAVAITPAGPPHGARSRYDLGLALHARFERTGHLPDLDEAVTAARESVLAEDPEFIPRRAILVVVLGSRFIRTGNLADLDEAITIGRELVAVTAADDPERCTYLSNLCAALITRFISTGNQADLDAGVDAGAEAVAATPDGHPSRIARLGNLSAALLTRFTRTGNLSDLDTAVDAGREAVTAIPADHPDRAGRLSSLSVALRERFEQTQNLSDLDEAIKTGREAVAASPADHPDRAGRLSNLSLALQARFEQTQNPSDLDKAINVGREAVAASPADHPERAGRLFNLGLLLRDQFEQMGNPFDLDETLSVNREAAALTTAPLSIRARAARQWGRTAAWNGRWRDATEGFAAAVGLMGLVAPRSLERGDQEYAVEELSGVGSDAAACCVRAGLPDRAVELLEQGRGIMLGQLLDSRTDLTALAERHPELAGQFIAARDSMDQVDGTHRPSSPVPDVPLSTVLGADYDATRIERLELRRHAAGEFDRVIAEIRGLPGFGGFLRPPSIVELRRYAQDGAVVLVNVSTYGSHALVLTGAGVAEPVPLDNLTPKIVEQRAGDFLTATADPTDPKADKALTDVLGWLWDVLAGPVLDRLGVTGPPREGQRWPRVWWSLSGMLSCLPVHAAGWHETRFDAVPATVIDRVVSSYTPTIRALGHTRRPHPDGATSWDGTGLVVAMPTTPDKPDLPGALDEAALLRQLRPDRCRVYHGAGATREQVLAAMRTAPWAHFACHGHADLDDPSTSHLLLNDHLTSPLTVLDVTRLRLEQAQLAFLSACSTAQPGRRLPDEAIHLASAFQLAGYRHVIGTLWPIRDQAAITVTEEIYRRLTPTGEAGAAGALHAATRRLRAQWAWQPSVWASHIHAGA